MIQYIIPPRVASRFQRRCFFLLLRFLMRDSPWLKTELVLCRACYRATIRLAKQSPTRDLEPPLPVLAPLCVISLYRSLLLVLVSCGGFFLFSLFPLLFLFFLSFFLPFLLECRPAFPRMPHYCRARGRVRSQQASKYDIVVGSSGLLDRVSPQRGDTLSEAWRQISVLRVHIGPNC